MTVDDSAVNSTTPLHKIIHKNLVKTSSANNLYDVFEYDTTDMVYVMPFVVGDNYTTTLFFSGIDVDHYKVIVRTSMITDSATKQLTYTIDGTADGPIGPPTAGNIYESTELSHEVNNLQVGITISTLAAAETAYIYTVTVVLLKCNSYCSYCPGGGNIKLYGSTVCGTSCEDGTYQSGSECLLCESTCGTCNGGTAAHCLSCGIKSGIVYYL